jgi:putative aldouronate transport system permease protein
MSMVAPPADLHDMGSGYRPGPAPKGNRPGGVRQGTRRSRFLIHLSFAIIAALFVVPLLVVVSASFSSEAAIGRYGYSIIPHDVTLAAYAYLFHQPGIIVRAFLVSIFVTVVGSFFSVLLMSMLAYPLSRVDFALRRPLSFYVFFTLLFSGGLVPLYILMVNYLHQSNEITALILPYLILPFFVLILRTYFAGIPKEILEAAKMDGAGEWRIFFRVVIPLSKPALATVGIFSLLIYWNDFLQSLLYISNSHLFPLQFLLYSLITDVGAAFPGTSATIPTQSVRMAMAVIATIPILIVFVAVQRFFVRGATVGAIKT